VAHREELDDLVAGWTRTRSPRAAVEELQSAGVPAGMMQRAADLPRDPHLTARGFLADMKHPMIDATLLGERAPAHFRTVADPPDRPAPVAGQHSREILGRVLELSEAELDRFVADGVVEQWTAEDLRV
jgi:crotonobetainyl-CoA:carnitine CoA-transferase CaiB-like acyl-CoA transferase